MGDIKSSLDNINNDVLFIYRYCHRDIPKLIIRRAITVLFFELVRDFSKTINGKITFIFISDNTPQEIINKINEIATGILGSDISFSIISIKQLPKRDENDRYPGRELPDGTISYICKPNLFPLSVPTKFVMKKFFPELKDDTIVFNCEDDYIYREDALAKIYLMAAANDDFVSGYDCSRLYRWPHETVIKYQFGHRWWAAPSVCATFTASIKTMKLHSKIFLSDGWKLYGDSDIWNGVKKMGLSKLWLSIPALSYHYNWDGYQWNFKEEYWDRLSSDIKKRPILF